MVRIYFVRHAQSDHSRVWEDRIRPLTEEGRQDTAAVLEFLKEKEVDLFYCSPYQRSIDTIRSSAEYFSKPILIEERFRERKAGVNGNSLNLIEKRWGNLDYYETDGESLHMVQNRNIAALKELLQAHEEKTLVIGTHGTALSTILHYYNPAFGYSDFLRILNWMPYIIELEFEGETLVNQKEHLHLYKKWQKQESEK